MVNFNHRLMLMTSGLDLWSERIAESDGLDTLLSKLQFSSADRLPISYRQLKM